MELWSAIALTVTAAALLGMALAQLAFVRQAVRLMRQTDQVVKDLQRDVRPLIEQARCVADDAAKVTSLAVAQVERVNEVVRLTASRVEETVAVIQRAVVEPLQNGAAVVAGFRAALKVFQSLNDSSKRAEREDDDALFIG